VASDLVKLTVPIFGQFANVTAFSDLPFQSSGQDLRFDGPFVPQIDQPSDDNAQTIGTPEGDALSNALSSLLGQSNVQVILTGLGSLTVGQKNSAITAVTNKLSPVLTALDDPLTALFNALGITVGGADITILSLNGSRPHEGPDQPALAR